MRFRGFAPLLILLLFPSIASAQTTARLTVQTDYRLRGFSLSSNEPVAIADIGHELGSGFYVNGAGLVVFDDGASLLGGQLNLGYARRLNSAVSVDAGVLRAEYTSSYSGGYAAHYTEFYVGAAARGLSLRAYFSPDYFRAGSTTLYGEIEAAIPVDANWRMNVHAGVLHYLDGAPPFSTRSTQLDWRLDLTRRLGRFEAFVSLSGVDPDYDLYRGGNRDNPAALAGLSFAF